MKHTQLLTPREVAEMLSIPKSTVYSLVKSTELTAIRVGPKLLKFRQKDVDDFILRNLTTTKTVEDSPVCEYIQARKPLLSQKLKKGDVL
jgi:excisionase family DNA binding protein